MNLTKKNAARLASISALGAGALGVATGTAEAAVHYTALNDKVGFGSGYGSGATLTLTGTAKITARAVSTVSTSSAKSSKIIGRSWSVFLRGSSVERSNASAGKTWAQLYSGGVGKNELVGSRSVRTFTGSNGKTHSPNGTFYRLFRFKKGGNYYYGWVALSQTVSGTVGPEVTVLGVAWDDTGAKIKAGDTGSTPATPLPSTLWLGGLGALALGATGLRRWRNARTAA